MIYTWTLLIVKKKKKKKENIQHFVVHSKKNFVNNNYEFYKEKRKMEI